MAATLTKALTITLACAYILALSCPTSLSLKCHSLYRVQRFMNKETLRLLAQMVKSSHSLCPPKHLDFQSPFEKNTSLVAESTLRRIIFHTKNIFKNDLSNVTTDKNAEDGAEKLQILLSEMLKLWTDCLYNKATSKETKIPGRPMKTIVIKTYFHKMKAYLKTEDYSPCAWAAVTSEVQKILRFVTRNTDILSEATQTN